MRRNLMVVVGLAGMVGGCGIFSAHSNVVEVAAGQELTAERLADILNRIKSPTMQFDTRVGTFVSSLWTDLTLFSQAVASNKLTNDSAFVADAMWPMIQETIYTRWMDTIISHRSKLTAASIDSAYNADQLRTVQHILIKAPEAAPKEVKDIARRKIEAILAKAKGGESFGKLAMANTEDQGSQADSGYYGPKPKGIYDPAFDKTLWSLKPGEMSGIVTSSFGYHVIRRPTAAESARLWRDTLNAGTAVAVGNEYEAELEKTSEMKIDASAIPHMRSALEDRPGHIADKTALASYKGGAFTTGDFVRWINAAMADPSRTADQEQGLKQQTDSQYTVMVTRMAKQALVLNEARKNKTQLTADEWKAMKQNFSDAVDSLKATVGLVGPSFDPKASSGDRSKAAAQKVEEYFNDITGGKKQPRMLPGILAATLREHEKTKFNAVALQHGLDLAKAQHTADSSKATSGAGAAPAGAALPAPIKPAPGGPPVHPEPAPKKP